MRFVNSLNIVVMFLGFILGAGVVINKGEMVVTIGAK